MKKILGLMILILSMNCFAHVPEHCNSDSLPEDKMHIMYVDKEQKEQIFFCSKCGLSWYSKSESSICPYHNK